MCLLHKAKLICSSVILCNKEVKSLQNMFLHNGYLRHFLVIVIKKFEVVNEPKSLDKNKENNFSYRLDVLYFQRCTT